MSYILSNKNLSWKASTRCLTVNVGLWISFSKTVSRSLNNLCSGVSYRPSHKSRPPTKAVIFLVLPAACVSTITHFWWCVKMFPTTCSKRFHLIKKKMIHMMISMQLHINKIKSFPSSSPAEFLFEVNKLRTLFKIQEFFLTEIIDTRIHLARYSNSRIQKSTCCLKMLSLLLAERGQRIQLTLECLKNFLVSSSWVCITPSCIQIDRTTFSNLRSNSKFWYHLNKNAKVYWRNKSVTNYSVILPSWGINHHLKFYHPKLAISHERLLVTCTLASPPALATQKKALAL